MTKPVATYRVQLNKDFNFYSLKDIVPYLAKLGISHIYASPIFQAKKGSTHGYDILDANRINDELGGADVFGELTKEVTTYGLEWIQDIVPNHVAYSTENEMIMDVMKKGSGSPYYSFFDVDWNHPSRRLKHRILAPFLETSYKEALKNGEIKLVYKEGCGFIVKYRSIEFPVKTAQSLYVQLDEATKKQAEKYYEDIVHLDKLLSMQVYVLDHWTIALKEINYRRFFDILDLICLRTEDTQVFETTHRLVFELLAQGKVSGLRIDHVDGLHNPEQYIERLRQKAPEAYIVVEKILTDEEHLPHTWQVQGTTGYDFLNYLTGLFVDKTKETQTNDCYRQFSRKQEFFNDLLHDCKKLVIEQEFSGEMDNLARLMLLALRKRPHGKKLSAARVRQALVELFAAFPVYRTYLNEKNASMKAQEHFRRALLQATQRNERLHIELEVFEKLLEECKNEPEALHVIMRLQQFTGVIMAKGFEDTVLYRYNRLLSLNDVGGNPAKFGVTPEEFHTFNRMRQTKWPSTLNATSTHDTKRGEDARARLNVLSEMPVEFKAHFENWAKLNTKLKKKVQGKVAPSSNEEYYIYQTLIGSLPFCKEDLSGFVERLKAHVIKSLREAKMHSNWISPQVAYEEAVAVFAAELLNPEESEEFLEDFLPFQEKVAAYGIVNSLAQTLLKITSPGIPDFYQGTELWQLNMVDPDNRRPVDFIKRQQMLEEVSTIEPTSSQDLLSKPHDGKLKLYLIVKALQARQKERALFEEGKYIPLKAEGPHANHVVAFCRKKAGTYGVTVVPRLLARLTMGQVDKLCKVEWNDTYVCLPYNAPRIWQNVFAEQQHRSEGTAGEGRLRVNELFRAFPVALLLSGGR